MIALILGMSEKEKARSTNEKLQKASGTLELLFINLFRKKCALN